MAISPLPLLLLAVLASTAAARPCKTLFYFSATTTTTYYPKKYNPLSHNPNSNTLFRDLTPRHLTLVFTSTSTVPDRSLNFDSISDESLSSDVPLKFYTSVSSSIRDRTRDIMSVIGALLLGVGCGALTAATMYFVWALFSPRGFNFDEGSSSSDAEDDDNDDEVAAMKRKLGYVEVSTNPKVDDDLKKPVPPTKEEV